VRNLLVAALILASVAPACSRAKDRRTLVPASTTMVTAWEVPWNPLTDSSLGDPRLAEQIRWGYRIFTDTPREAARFTPSKVACSNCHLNAGQRERALPVVGVVGVFPEYNARAARLISLTDRIVDCFLRSETATGRLTPDDPAAESAPAPTDAVPTPTSK
jgi:cytochrome c